MPRLRTAYKEIAICIVPVIAIALLARVATGTFSLPEIFLGRSAQSAAFIAQADDPDGASGLARGEKYNLWGEIENRGPAEWTKDGPDAVLLESSRLISDPWYSPGSTWLSQNKIGLWEDRVPVGERGHFIFTINTDLREGKYTAHFNVVDANLKPLQGLGQINWKINIAEPTYGFELIDASTPLSTEDSADSAVKPGEQATRWVRYKNTGNTVWKNFGEHPLALTITDPEAVRPLRIENRWIDERRVAWLDQPSVAPGETGTFTFPLQIPDDFKSQTIELRPEVEGLEVADIPPVNFELAASKDKIAQSETPVVGSATDFTSPADLRLTAVAAEHGDCYIARTPSGQVLVFDTAHPSRANVVVDALRRLGVTKIDYLFLSHPHWDHIGGAAEVLDNFEVDKIYINGEGYPFDTYAELVKSLAKNTDRVKLIARGEVIEAADDVRVEILHPDKTLSGVSDDDEAVNNNSLVARLVFGDTAVLLPGDIYQSSMEELVASGSDLSAAVLILPHHGNDGFDENDSAFLAAVDPRVVVKSSSWAEYQDQTSAEMRQFLGDHKIPLFATAELGELNLALGPEGEVKLSSESLVWK